jgi:plastocyanin
MLPGYGGRKEVTMPVFSRAARPSLAMLTATALALSACGGGGGGSSTPTSTPKATASPASTPNAAANTGTVLALQADKTQLKFDKSTLSAKAGKVTITMANPSALQHNVAIEGHGVHAAGKIVSQGGTSTVTATLKPGKYTFYCAVDGHRQAGMEGTLTVK